MEQANIALVYALTSLIAVVTLVVLGWGIYMLDDIIKESRRWPETMKLFKWNKYD